MEEEVIHLDYKRDISTVKDVTSEAGIIATLIFRPEFSFYSDQLLPGHFTEASNAWMYWAIRELAKKGVDKIDAYNLINILSLSNASARGKEILTIDIINDFIGNAELIARTSEEEYNILVNNVLKTAFRRDTYKKLAECQAMCFDDDLSDIEQKIYSSLDDVMMQFSTTTDVPQYKDVVDDLWHEIIDRQEKGMSGIPFKFPKLSEYVSIEPGELVIFAAEAKQGKSMMLLNCAVDLLKKGKKVLYVDSELNSRLFTCRLISHLAQIEFSRVRSGNYSEEEAAKIAECIAWMKQNSFTHIYMPMFDIQSIYTTTKKMKHTTGLDVIIIDYFKSGSETDAFATYAEMGAFVDLMGPFSK